MQSNSVTPERAVTMFNETFVLARISLECKTKRYIKVHSPRSLCVLCHSREVCLITRSETRAKVRANFTPLPRYPPVTRQQHAFFVEDHYFTFTYPIIFIWKYSFPY